jgi:flagellar basal-body rod protein FlgF
MSGVGIYQAVSGAVAQTHLLDTVANNLANVGTTGFKNNRVRFDEVLARAAGRGRPLQGSFVRAGMTAMDLRPGPLRPSENPLDVALEGAGYLTVRDGSELAYTRGGTLKIRSDGLLADSEGRPLLGKNDRPIETGVDPVGLVIERDGRVRTAEGDVGVLKLVEAVRPEAMKRKGQNLLVAPPAALKAATGTEVRQRHLESSNVNAVTEITSMIVASRTYETLHRVISTFRDMDTRAANDLGQER